MNTPAERVWLFDLDDTLHDASARVFPQIHHSMGAYIARHLNLSDEAAASLRSHYWRRYGATLLGMMKHHQINPRHFLWHTHQFDDLSALLSFEPALSSILRRLPGRKILFSNAPRHYASAVLRGMGIAHHFQGINAIEDIGYTPKPSLEGFRRLLRKERLNPGNCILIEDSLANLATAARLGITTVWLSKSLRRPPYVDFQLRTITELPQVIRAL